MPDQGGCPEDVDASLFGVGAAVLRWQSRCAAWYHAGLVPGRTHLDVNVRTAYKVADLLATNDVAAQYLARGARALFAALLCPACVARAWAAALAAVRGRFGFADLDARRVRAALADADVDLQPFHARRPLATFDAATDKALRAVLSEASKARAA